MVKQILIIYICVDNSRMQEVEDTVLTVTTSTGV